MTKGTNLKDYKLAVILDDIAYFTDREPQELLGDDWDDAPYEHNAGKPMYKCYQRKRGQGLIYFFEGIEDRRDERAKLD